MSINDGEEVVDLDAEENGVLPTIAVSVAADVKTGSDCLPEQESKRRCSSAGDDTVARASSHSVGATLLLRNGVTQYYKRLREAEPEHIGRFRDIDIVVKGFGFSVSIPAAAQIDTIKKNKYTPGKADECTLDVLDDINLNIKSGTVTLILGAPGCGKSSLLKALGGQLRGSKSSKMRGDVYYNGLPVEQVDLLRTVALIDQTDSHIPVLTVRETLDFANDCQNGVKATHGTGDQYAKMSKNVDVILRLLGLDVCADTVVGNEKVRGVSGGQRRRVTSAEIMVSGTSVLLCDEISTGLDSSATLDIVRALRSWARAMNGTAVIALLQPPPEVVALFDQIICLDQGNVVFAGTADETEAHFQHLGFTCPQRKDFADFLQEVTNVHGLQYYDSEQAIVEHAKNRSIANPFTVEDFVKLYRESIVYGELSTTINAKAANFEGCANLAADAVRLLKPAKTKDRFANGFVDSFKLLARRQWTLTMRDKNMLRSLFGEALLVGLLMGGVFYQLAAIQHVDTPRPGVGALFFCCAILQRQAWQQIPIMMNARPIFYKQRQRDFFPTLVFVFAFTAVQIPINVASMAVFCPIVYFMVGYSVTAQHFFFFFLTMVFLQHALRSIFLAVGAATRSASSAQYSASILVAMFLLFSGYILSFDIIPVYWQWAFYINPLAYGLRSLVLNEYRSEKYTPAQQEQVLTQYGLFDQSTTLWMWAGPIIFACYYVFFNFATVACLHFVRYDGVTGKAKLDTVQPAPKTHLDAEEGGEKASPEDSFRVENHEFIPVTICFQDVSYTVYPPKQGPEGIQLLDKVSGIFRPGKMTALMGSSGAGKTTLMDVIAGRKNTGKIEGTIAINGVPASPKDFSKISGYCEQMDIHSPEATVREAFRFSAMLRQPEEIPVAEKLRFVEHVIDILDLHSVSDRLIGASTLVGLSVEQRKRVTIGVELSANPAVIFADEPTSGLDARAAMIVMRALRRISSANRTVVCTIHQPNTVIFEMFDELLLLQRGGVTIYNSELGQESSNLIRYFESNGADPICPGENPANYMLSVIGAGVGKAHDPTPPKHDLRSQVIAEEEEEDDDDIYSGTATQDVPSQDFGIVYKNSKLKRHVDKRVAAQLKDGDKESVLKLLSYPDDRAMATSVLFQLKECSRKAFTTYWRTPQYNVKRVIILIILALIFGTAYLYAGPVFPITNLRQARSVGALIYLCMDFVGILNMVTVLPVTFSERTVYYRERAAQTYSSRAYMFSIFVVELPYLVISIAVFVFIMYFLIGLPAQMVGYFFVVFWLYVSLCTYLGQLIAIASPNEIVGQVLVGFLTVIFNLFSGYLVSRTQITVALQWVMWLSPSSYAFNGLASTQLANCPNPTDDFIGCQNITVLDPATQNEVVQTVAEWSENTFDLRLEDVYDVDIPVLIGFVVFTLVLCAFSLKYIKHDTK
uniref:ABC transporter domain-containing protein n=1 Tax=Mucochytrium quahogii TaxID=96639 RepID=A0A7S2WG22_9STRA|mmetsp:Transcript_7427/g.11943  ORF Transcript_7427/g.11943 Transcript_7427/m.11943 type:complete len:1429 (+) Transcript_7427:437-4723(+)